MDLVSSGNMNLEPVGSAPDSILSTSISRLLNEVSSCKYKSCKPMTSFDNGVADI